MLVFINFILGGKILFAISYPNGLPHPKSSLVSVFSFSPGFANLLSTQSEEESESIQSEEESESIQSESESESDPQNASSVEES